MQGMEDTKLFETTVRAAIKEEPLFETVNLLENDSIFQQRFNQGDKTWIKANTMIDELLYVVNLLVENDHPVMITGGRESSLLSKAYMTKMSNFNSHLIFPGSDMPNQDCLKEITANMSKKGENVLIPDDGVKTVPIVVGLENRPVLQSSCLLTTLSEIAKHGVFYSEEDGYRRMKLQNLALICQYDSTKNLRTLHSFLGIQYFNILSLKDNSPLSVLQTHASTCSKLTEEMISKTHELFLSFEKKSVELGEKSPISILQLPGIDSFSSCLEMYDERYGNTSDENTEQYWKRALDEHFVEPLWTTLAQNIVAECFLDSGIDLSTLSHKEFTHQNSETQSQSFARVVHEIGNILKDGFNRLIIIVGSRGVGKASAIAEACKNQGVSLFPNVVNPLEFKWNDYQKMIQPASEAEKAVGFTVNAPYLDQFSERDGSLENYSGSLKACLRQTERAVFFVRLNVNEFPSSFLRKLISYVRKYSTIIGVPDWTPNDLRFCHDSNTMQIQEDPLLNIHIAIERYCKTINCTFFPSPAMLKLAYHSTDLRIKQNTEILQTRRVLLDGVLEKLQKWDELIELWTKELEKVFLGNYHFMFWSKCIMIIYATSL